jgi:hypothetical protein
MRARFAFAGASAELGRTLPLAAHEAVVFHGVMRLRSRGRLPRPTLLRLTQPRLAVLAHYAFRPDWVWDLPFAAVQTVDLVGRAVHITWTGDDRTVGLLQLTPWRGRPALDRPLRDPGQVADTLARWRWVQLPRRALLCVIVGEDGSVEFSLRRRVQQPWALDVPYSPTELSERLSSCTSLGGHRWYLSQTNAGQRSPVFRGTVAEQRVHLARFAPTLERNSFVAWLDADICSSPRGGARLSGTVGLASAWSFLWPWMLFGNIVVFAGWLAFAVHLLLSGRLLVALLFVGVVAVVVAVEVISLRAGLRSMHADHAELNVALTDTLR